jgi:hypothetical protein
LCSGETNKQTQTRAQKNKANKPHEILGIRLMHSLGQPRHNAVGEQRPGQQRAHRAPPTHENAMASLLWMHRDVCSGGAREKMKR